MAVLMDEELKLAISSTGAANNESDIVIVNDTLPYGNFFTDFLCQNKLCVLKGSCKFWKSSNQWTIKNKETGELEIDTAYLRNNFGHAIVPVANCNKFDYNSHSKEKMTLLTYLDYLDQTHVKDLLYLKDWHFTKVFPGYKAYEVPIYFSSDWLNEFCDAGLKDDYRFVYIGPNDSWTPFHADVFRSYSWSANICGKKEWVFYPPGKEKKLASRKDSLPTDVKAAMTYENDTDKIVVLQEEGDIIFVPSNWFHQVTNIGKTISINHNWINGTNIHFVWNYLKTCLEEVKSAINDCSLASDWLEQCQILLKAVEGIDYYEFYRLLKCIGKNRVILIKNSLNNNYKSNVNHALFDLIRIDKIIEEVIASGQMSETNMCCNEYKDYQKLDTEIKEIVNKFGL